MQAKKIFTLVLICIAPAVLILKYVHAKADRARAKLGPYDTVVAPSKEYSIKSYYISSGEPMVLLFQVYDHDNNLIAEYTRDAWPGAATETWVCKGGPCTEFYFETGDAAPIKFPPSWVDKLRAKIP
jgi:hypothetical protein